MEAKIEPLLEKFIAYADGQVRRECCQQYGLSEELPIDRAIMVLIWFEYAELVQTDGQWTWVATDRLGTSKLRARARAALNRRTEV